MKKGTELIDKDGLVVMVTKDIKELDTHFEGVVIQSDAHHEKGEYDVKWYLDYFIPLNVYNFNYNTTIGEAVTKFRGEENEPLDGDRVDLLTEVIKYVINEGEGNI